MVVTSRDARVLLALGCGVATFLGYVTFSGLPDPSTAAVIHMALFYVATVIYPPWWTIQHLRALNRLGVDEPELRRRAWVPVIVGGTAFVTALGLLRALL